MGRTLCTFTERFNPQSVGIPGIVTELIRTVNHFQSEYSLPSNSQSNQCYCILRGIVDVDTLMSTILRLGTFNRPDWPLRLTTVAELRWAYASINIILFISIYKNILWVFYRNVTTSCCL